MKNVILTSLLVVAVSGCTEFKTMYRAGNTKTDTNVDQAQCNRLASDRYPPNIVTNWYPIYDSQGRVVSRRVEQYDINEGPRRTASRTCMFERGYEWAAIPYCKDEQLADRSYAPITTKPELSTNICGLRTKDHGRVLIDLSKPI